MHLSDDCNAFPIYLPKFGFHSFKIAQAWTSLDCIA